MNQELSLAGFVALARRDLTTVDDSIAATPLGVYELATGRACGDPLTVGDLQGFKPEVLLIRFGPHLFPVADDRLNNLVAVLEQT